MTHPVLHNLNDRILPEAGCVVDFVVNDKSDKIIYQADGPYHFFCTSNGTITSN